MSEPTKTPGRFQIYQSDSAIISAHRRAVELGIIKCKSTDARIQKLLAKDLKEKANDLRKAGVKVPCSAFDR